MIIKKITGGEMKTLTKMFVLCWCLFLCTSLIAKDVTTQEEILNPLEKQITPKEKIQNEKDRLKEINDAKNDFYRLEKTRIYNEKLNSSVEIEEVENAHPMNSKLLKLQELTKIELEEARIQEKIEEEFFTIKNDAGVDVVIDVEEFLMHIEQFHQSGDNIHKQGGHYFTVNDNLRRLLNEKIASN